MSEAIELIHGDCYDVMPTLPDAHFDMVFADLPYGVTKNPWDSVIDLGWLWPQYRRLAKPNAPVLLFAQGLFAASLMLSNRKEYRYEWIWRKLNSSSGFLNAKKMPLRNHDNILVFYRKPPVYNPQFSKGRANHARGHGNAASRNQNYGEYASVATDTNVTMKYPKTVLEFAVVPNSKRLHSTEKPVDLCQYLIETYTNEGAIILDNCAGSAATLEAAYRCGRQAVGIEKDESIYQRARDRIDGVMGAQNT
jgi:site-specific DNA-methyltransferase (adenine-specific)